MRVLVTASSLLAALTLSASASAFCGFYVSGSGDKLANEATQVVLMRAGTRTVLSMQNAYKGPPQGFALVVPVPVVLQKDQVKTLERGLFDKVEQLDAPRLVEYWEEDPCENTGMGLGNLGTIGHGAGTGSGQGFGNGHGRLGVTVEAQFTVGEYEIVILSAKDSTGLDTWLKENKYAIPDGAEPVLRPYVAAGMKFFVAKVDVTKVRFEDGRAILSPLRFQYDADTFSLPVRLGLLNSGGTQDLIVHILARGQRYEAANYKNVTMPTNLDVDPKARADFAPFYAALFDRVVEKNPGAVVTEYAWDAAQCDPCPGPTLTANDIATLGADALAGDAGKLPLGPAQKVTVTGSDLPTAVVERIVRQNAGRFGLCPASTADVNATLTIDTQGSVKDVSVTGAAGDEDAQKCVQRGLANVSFPTPSKPTKVTFSIVRATGRFYGTAGFTLTRLHMRYAKDALGDDLVFREVPPIVGGREFMQESGDGGARLEERSRPASTNNFQARYAIRHPWPGPITCANPVRGRWGSPWPDAGTPYTSPQAATKTAFAQRGNVQLASYVDPKLVPELELAGYVPPPAPAPSAAASAASPAKTGGCGSCNTGSGGTDSPLVLGGAGFVLLAVLRRYHRRREND